MRKSQAVVVVNKPIQILAANGKPAVLLRPGSRKGTVVVEFDPEAEVILGYPTGTGVFEEELFEATIIVETEPDEEEDGECE